MKHLYSAKIDIQRGRNRIWLTNWSTFNVVANGDAQKAIRKVQRKAKKQIGCHAVRVTGIQQIAQVDAI
jgi:hypothetical protein